MVDNQNTNLICRVRQRFYGCSLQLSQTAIGYHHQIAQQTNQIRVHGCFVPECGGPRQTNTAALILQKNKRVGTTFTLEKMQRMMGEKAGDGRRRGMGWAVGPLCFYVGHKGAILIGAGDGTRCENTSALLELNQFYPKQPKVSFSQNHKN